MDEKLLAEAKALYQKLDFIIKAPSSKTIIMQLTNNVIKSDILDNIMYYDTVRFVTFVVGTGGILSTYHLDVINQLSDKCLTSESLRKLMSIKGLDIEFASKTPVCASVLCGLENVIYASNKAISSNVSIMNMLLDYFQAVGRLLISDTDYFADLKKSLLEDALNTIKDFAKKYSRCPYFRC